MSNTIVDYEVGGIHVARRQPGSESLTRSTPVLLVHGGLHGSWCWDTFTEYLSDRGWDCHALNWRGRGRSQPLDPDQVLSRSIEDVVPDIETVASQFEEPPIVIAHSMGALATLKFAERNRHAGLVLLTPALPQEATPERLEIPTDPAHMWGPPPFELSKELFFSGTDEELARHYHELLVAESPRAVAEVTTEWSVSVDPVRISGPLLVLAAEHDTLSDPVAVHRLARVLNADYRFAAGFGHGVTLDRNRDYIAGEAHRWLCAVAGAPQAQVTT
ncbi:alpha/beta hydrolase [Nonomuraea sp. NPDC049400]|uniref:alpha/beta hydrolase n=1 Tax=Nonomuraea sp. NPDC049400 TaxID=3364352 RepID=UPI0037A969CC